MNTNKDSATLTHVRAQNEDTVYQQAAVIPMPVAPAPKQTDVLCPVYGDAIFNSAMPNFDPLEALEFLNNQNRLKNGKYKIQTFAAVERNAGMGNVQGG